jgi:hypothetical protein
MILDVLDIWLAENSDRFSTSNIIIEVNEKINDLKQTLVLAHGDKMASIELIKSGTIDLIIVDCESERIIFSETLQKQTSESIRIALDNFVNTMLHI